MDLGNISREGLSMGSVDESEIRVRKSFQTDLILNRISEHLRQEVPEAILPT